MRREKVHDRNYLDGGGEKWRTSLGKKWRKGSNLPNHA